MTQDRGQKEKSGAFTILEVLVVAALVAVIASVAFPAVLRAKAAAKQSHCIQNLHQLDTALRLYGADWDDLHTRPPSFSPNLYPYAKSAEVFRCQEDATDRHVRPSSKYNQWTYTDNVYDLTDIHPRAAFQQSYWFRGYDFRFDGHEPSHLWSRMMSLPKLGIVVCIFHAPLDPSQAFPAPHEHAGPREGPCLRIVPDGSLFVGHSKSRTETGGRAGWQACLDLPHTYRDLQGGPR